LIKNENISVNYNQNVSFDIVEQSVLAVNVYYKSDTIRKITEKAAIGIEEFVSNIGGNYLKKQKLTLSKAY